MNFIRRNYHILLGVMLTGFIALAVIYNMSFAQDEEVVKENSKFSDVVLQVGSIETNLSMVGGNHYYNEDTGKLLFSEDTVFELTVVSDFDMKVGVALSDGSVNYVESYDKNKFLLSGLSMDSSIVIEDPDSNVYSTSFVSYVSENYEGVQALDFVVDKPELKLERSVAEISDGYARGSLEYLVYYSIDEGLSLSDYSFSAKFNDVAIPFSSIDVSASGLMKVIIPADSEEFGLVGKEGNCEFSLSLSDNVGGTVNVSDTIGYDNVAPIVASKNIFTVGDDGTAYLNTNGGDCKIGFSVTDNGVGIGSVKVYEGETELVVESVEDTYYAVIDSTDIVIEAYDNLGNSVKYSLGELLSVEGDIKIGYPEVVISETVTGSVVGDWYYGDSIKLDIVIPDVEGVISSVVVDINSKQDSIGYDSESKSYKYSVDLAELGYAEVSVLVSAVYSDGCTRVDKELFYKIDNEVPSLNDISVNKDIYNVYDDVAYLSSNVIVNGTPQDNHSGIGSIEVYLDDKLIGNSLPIDSNGSGVYSIKLKDNVGNEKVYLLSDLVGKDFSSVFVSSTIPSVTINEVEWILLDGVSWSKGVDSLGFSINSDNLKDVTAKLNDKVVDYKEENGVYYIDTKNLECGMYTLSVDVLNKNGLTSSGSMSFGIDNESPKVDSCKLNGVYSHHNGNIYFKDSLEVVASGLDALSGIKNIALVNSTGSAVSNNIIDADDEYFIKLEDNLGNTSSLSLKDLCGLESNSFIKDVGAPKITISLADGGLGTDANIYGGDVDLGLVLKDDVLLKSIKVLCNGLEVYVGGDVAEYAETINTKDLKASADGKYELVVSCEDTVGNKADAGCTLYVDTQAPVLEKVVLGSDYLDRGGSVWFNSSPNLEIVAGDNLVSITEYRVLNKDGSSSKFDTNVVTLKTGDYAVELVDNFGNTSKAVELKDLLKFSGEFISIDTKKPSVECSRPEGDIEGWFASDVTYSMSVIDDTAIYVARVYINNKEIHEYKPDSVGVTSTEIKASTKGIKSENNNYKIRVVVIDYSGNEVSWSDEIKIDRVSPNIESGSISKEFKDYSYGAYFNSNPDFSVGGTDFEYGSGIVKFILRELSKGVEVEDVNGKFTLDSGVFDVVAVDMVGNESVGKSFKDLIGSQSNNVFVDSLNPIISCARPDGDLDGWYSKDVEYIARLTDNLGIRFASISVNGTVIGSVTADDGSLTEKELKAKTSDVESEGYKRVISVYVEDNAGNTSTWEDTVYIDTLAPEQVSVSLLGDKVERPYGVFFYSNPILMLEYADSGVGTKGYYLKNNDDVVDSNVGEFTLSDGNYSINVEDRLGNNISYISLKKLLGLSSNKFVVDNIKPVINCSRPEGSINDWFGGDVVYKVSLSDDKGIYSAKVIINDVEVDSYTATEGDILKVDLTGKTADVEEPENGVYSIKVVVSDNYGNTSEWSDTIRIDRNNPVIERFVITDEGYLEGESIGGSDDYGFFLSGATGVEVYVSDNVVSSGLSELSYRLLNDDLSVNKEGVLDIVGGVAVIDIPDNFKGYIESEAKDRVGHASGVAKPDGIITEDSNVHINTSSIGIKLPENSNTDNSGNTLYNKNITVSVDVVDSTSGLRNIEWGIGEESRGTLSIDIDGNITGDINYNVTESDKNLVLKLSSSIEIGDNANDLKLWYKVEDRVGNVSKSSRVFSIDKDKPVLSVSYNATNESVYYNSNRVAVVKILERNFNPSDVVFGGDNGSIGNWVSEDGSWTNTITFAENAEYQWSIGYTDLAGNSADSYSSEKFVVDKINPVTHVSFDNNDYSNELYYKQGRVATVTVVEKNFNSSLFQLQGASSVSSWSSDGDTHTCQVTYSDDGEYSLSISGNDLSGNSSNTVSFTKFIVDKKTPEVTLSGVQTGVSYKSNVKFTLTANDINIDTDRSTVELTGRTNGSMKLTGGFEGNVGSFSFTGVSEEEIYDDLYTIYYSIYDLAGNVYEDTVVFSINRYGSDYEFTEEHMLNNIVSRSSDIMLVESSVDRLDLGSSRVVIIRDGNSIEYDLDLVSVKESGGTEGEWVYSYSIDSSAFDSDGKYQVQLYSKAMDGTDNSSLSQEFSFILDSSEPEVIVSGVESDEYYLEVSKNVAIDVRDLTGVNILKAFINDTEVDVNVGEDGLYYVTMNESTDEQSLKVFAVDKAGNESIVLLEDIFISSSVAQSLLNNTLVRVGIAILVLSLVGIITLLVVRVRKARVEEISSAEETIKMYNKSSTGSGILSEDNEHVEDNINANEGEVSYESENSDKLVEVTEISNEEEIK